MTKEETTKEKTILGFENQKLLDNDERRKKEFAKTFNWYKKKENFGYSNDSELITPSWEQIFVEVGKLLAVKGYNNYKEVIEKMGINLGVLIEKDLEKENEKLNN